MSFIEIDARHINGNPVKMIADEWMLICAGDEVQHNMMTASWGFLGEMWGKDCAVAGIRPTRYTYGLVEKTDTFALCFMGEQHKSVHKICGSQSGRDIDKVNETGLTPVFTDDTMYFEQARLVIICRKVYAQDIDPKCFIDKSADKKWYNDDYHRMYFGEIIKVLEKAD